MNTPQAHDTLHNLYSFLDDNAAPVTGDAALLDSMQQKAADSIVAKQRFFAENGPAVIAVAHALADVYRRGGRVLTMGNGGSSCDANHFAVEFQHPVTAGRPALPALSLVADQAMLTAVGNDVGFEHVYLRQLIAHARSGDALVGFSTSGQSANLLKAYTKAKAMGVTTIGFAGGDGGAMARSTDVQHCLVVATDSIHRVQEVHVAIYHILWDLVHTLLATQRGPSCHEVAS